MRVAIVNHARYDETSFNIAGTTLAGRLYLYGDPTMPMEATTKRYVDNVALSINAGSISTGTLNSARMPGVTGDFTSADGSANLTLTDSGIVAGTYTKLTIDSSGRALVGLGVGNGDLPLISWSKIVNNKPTTLEGYGINDGVINTSPTLTGYASLPGNPVSGTQLATKQYVDALAAGGSSLKVGDTIRRPSSITPSGFLRCNGGEVSQTTYSALYAIIGDTYSNIVIPGSGKPWQYQYAINASLTGDITGWVNDSSKSPSSTYASGYPIVTKNRIYLLGGSVTDVGGGATDETHTCVINSDGSLGAWSSGTPLPVPSAGGTAIVTKNRVYLLGGWTDSLLTVDLRNTYTAPINADGTIGAWTTGTKLPAAVYSVSTAITKNRIYLLGEPADSGSNLAFYTATISSDGILGEWSTVSESDWPPAVVNSPDQASDAGGLIQVKNKIYVSGRTTTSCATINGDGTIGSWESVDHISIPDGSNIFITKKAIYSIGGYDRLHVGIHPINPDGTFGTYVAGTNVPKGLAGCSVLSTNGKLYLIGGYGLGGTSSNCLIAPITGGLNDYSAYYDGTYTATTAGYFNLPDTTSTDVANIFTYIKY